MPDTRTILHVHVDPDHPGRTLMDLSDNSTVWFGDWIAANDSAGNVIRAEIRNPDGSLTGDGPVLTDDARVQFVALGVENIPVATPIVTIAHHGATPSSPDASGTPNPPSQPVPVPAANHQQAANRLASLFAQFDQKSHGALHTIAALLGIHIPAQ